MQGVDHPDPAVLLQAIASYVSTAMDDQLSAGGEAKVQVCFF
jgi:hypothetical protein